MLRRRTMILIVILVITTLMIVAYTAVALTMIRAGQPVRPTSAKLPFVSLRWSGPEYTMWTLLVNRS